MKQVFLDKLPRWENGRYKGTINWKESIGYKVKFIYDDIEGKIKIVDYQSKGQIVYIKYLNKDIFRIASSSLKKCMLGELLGKINHEYLYEKEEIISTITGEIKILNKIKIENNKHFIKGYEYKCLKDNYIGKISEYDIKKGNGCPVCSNKKTIKGINDVATTHPHLIKFFRNINDAYTYTYGSNKSIELKCPDCGYKKKMKLSTLTIYGFSCNQCGDGISYPNKIIFNILKQLITNFEAEKQFKWSKNIFNKNKKIKGNKQYDFYFKYNNDEYIIEANGLQHYQSNTFEYCGGRNLQEEQENDIIKKELAIQNGIKEKNYIIIDCRYSELEFIKNNILHSRLNDIFNLNIIDWVQCEEFALNNRVKEASDLWNSGIHNITQISILMGMEKSTIKKYINKGLKIGWNNYDGKLEHIKSANRNRIKYKVKCLETGDVFESYHELDRKSELIFGVKLDFRSIARACDDGNWYKGFHFIKINEVNKKNENHNGKQIEIFKDNISLGIFPSCAELERQSEKLFGVKLNRGKMSAVCTNKRKTHKGFTFKYINSEREVN